MSPPIWFTPSLGKVFRFPTRKRDFEMTPIHSLLPATWSGVRAKWGQVATVVLPHLWESGKFLKSTEKPAKIRRWPVIQMPQIPMNYDEAATVILFCFRTWITQCWETKKTSHDFAGESCDWGPKGIRWEAFSPHHPPRRGIRLPMTTNYSTWDAFRRIC